MLVGPWHLPTTSETMLMREHFGERIGFMFSFYELACNSLLYLSILSFIPFVLNLPGLVDVSPRVQNGAKCIFFFVVYLWLATFRSWCNGSQKLYQRSWGMNEEISLAEPSPGWRSAAKEKWTERSSKFISRVVLLVYLALYFGAYKFFVLDTRRWLPTWIDSEIYRAKAVAVLAILFSLIWSNVADFLVRRANHYSHAAFLAELIALVPKVKMVTYIFPYVYSTIFGYYSGTVCGSSKEGVADEFFGFNSTNIPESIFDSTSCYENWLVYNLVSAPGMFDKLMGSFTGAKEAFSGNFTSCIIGEKPVDCTPVNGIVECLGKSYFAQRSAAPILYISTIVLSFIFKFWPIIKIKYEVQKEFDSVPDATEYSWTQYWRKAQKEATYGHLQWGGSFVEDMMDPMLLLTITMCFALIYPIFVFACFVVMMVDYRLLAYRLIMVTGRPYPSRADGLGKWNEYLKLITIVSLYFNVLQVLFYTRLGISWTRDQRIVIAFMGTGILLVFNEFLALASELYPSSLTEVAATDKQIHQQRVYSKIKVIPSEDPGVDSPRVPDKS
jgi:hypothetical protein